MNFEIIEQEKWHRKECFDHFMNVANCSYSITVNVEITNLYSYIKNKKLRLYPTFTWIISKCINAQREFRMGYNTEGKLGYFNNINPSYSVINKETKVMKDLCTKYSENFIKFYDNMTGSLDIYKKNADYSTEFCPNFFIVSCLPWISYTAFNVNNHGGKPFLFPMVTWGKYFKQKDKIYIPISIQVHHAAADGYHCSLFFSNVEEIIKNPNEYLRDCGRA